MPPPVLLLLLLLLLAPIRAMNSAEQSVLDNWYNGLTNKGNLPSTSPADWCSLSSAITCGTGSKNSGRALTINFSAMGIAGTIPSEFATLTYLTKLDLSSNQFTGTLPTQLSSLTALQELNVQDNQLSGTLSPVLTNSASLRQFHLAFNQFSGTIPSFIGSGFRRINLQSNQFTGSIPTLTTPTLNKLLLQNNQLTGSIPTTLTSSLPSVSDIRLSNNNLTGTIPTELTSVATLAIVNLSNNQLTGTIPPLSSLLSLETLSLSYNQLTGTIPPLNSLTSLASLSLSNNQLTGTIPSFTNSFIYFSSLSLSYNQLTGTVPSFDKLAFLTSLSLSNNQFTGTVPSFNKLTYLTTLSLSYNQLTGTIPSFNELVSLTTLALDNNLLSGTVPPMTIPLQQLYLNGNQLTGTIPSFVSSFIALDLSSNLLTGSVPSSLNQLTLLQELNLSSNLLTGTVPTLSLGSLNFLYLQGSGNNFCPIVDYSMWALNDTDFQSSTSCEACTATTCQNSGSCSGGPNELFTCTCSSTWIGVNCETLACPATTVGLVTLPITATGSSATGSCPAGYAGSPSSPCTLDGTWGDITGSCQQLFCPQVTVDQATFLSTAAGSSATGSCTPGYAGSPSRSCKLDGTWDDITGSCVQLFCSAETTGHADFAETAAGSTASGSCLGDYVGSPSRLCKLDGTWDVVANPCQLFCPQVTLGHATFAETAAGSTASGSCIAGYSGSPSRPCKLDGTWDDITGSCVQLFCPAETAGHADFAETAAGSTATSSCPAGFAGSPSRSCKLDGTWDAVLQPCQQLFCPAQIAQHASFPATPAGSTASGSCIAGYSGSPSRSCKLDGTWDDLTGAICAPITNPSPTANPTPAPTSTPPTGQHGESNLSTEALIGIIVGSVAGFLLILGLGGVIYYHLRGARRTKIHDSGLELKGGSMGEMSEFGAKF